MKYIRTWFGKEIGKTKGFVRNIKDLQGETWTCDICKEVKPDNKISVLTYPILGFAGATRNLKYCDNPECYAHALEKANEGSL
jgi:hypothetical protein